MADLQKCFISQGFGENANPLYAGAGQKGHTGVDEVCGYGTPIYALKKGTVYKILDAEHPANDGSGYWGIFIIADDPELCEWQVGHCSKILCKVGDHVEPWTIIGEEGNHGGIYAGGIQITKAMQDAGDHRGSHRHWNKKPLQRKTEAQMDAEGGQYITSFSTASVPPMYRDAQGFYYQVPDYLNGYNGSVNPLADIDAGYKAINEHNNSQQVDPATEKVVEDGIKAVTFAMRYPALYGIAMKILQGLASLLSMK